MKYCKTCQYGITLYREKDSYYCWCKKFEKEVGFYKKPCGDYK